MSSRINGINGNIIANYSNRTQVQPVLDNNNNNIKQIIYTNTLCPICDHNCVHKNLINAEIYNTHSFTSNSM